MLSSVSFVFSVIILSATSDESYASDCRCGIEGLASRIVGGREVVTGTYPWIVGIVSRPSFYSASTLIQESKVTGTGYAYCAGSLINDRFVLTAAHCVSGVPINDIKVTLGSNSLEDLTSKPSEKVADVIIFNFDSQLVTNDYALIKLAKPVSFNEKVSPICLASNNYFDNLFVTGWGLTDAKMYGGKLSPVLKEVDVDPIRDSTCARFWDTFNPYNQLCSGSSSIGSACQGDSGGPLSTRKNGQVFQVGIVSYGDSDCGVDSSIPTIYTRISGVADKIRGAISEIDSIDGLRTTWCK